MYVGLSVFAKTRKQQLVDMLHENGLSISYDRVLELSVQLGEAVVAQYEVDGVVCPLVMRRYLFATLAVDNTDHNPTATTATTSFHDTSVSVFQHPSSAHRGEEIRQLTLKPDVKKMPQLPEAFTSVTSATNARNLSRLTAGFDSYTPPKSIHSHLKQEYAWLEKVKVTEMADEETSITLASHHAKVSICSLLPLFLEQAHSVAAIKHVMVKIRQTVEFLNPGQIPVIPAYQPLYALAKQIQWQWSEYGKDGGLHTEMAALRPLGTLLEGSGWTSALVEAGVVSAGTAESHLTAASVTCTRQAHQITAASLYGLPKQAHRDSCDTGEPNLTFEDRCDQRKLESPQIQFWHLMLDMELAMFLFICSLREGSFEVYCEALSELIPYFFANNNVNFAR